MSRIVCSYNLSSGSAERRSPSRRTTGGPIRTEQLWTFEVYDNTTGQWTLLGDNTFAPDWVWAKHTFTLPVPYARFFSSNRRSCKIDTVRRATWTHPTSIN